MTETVTVEATPDSFEFTPDSTALIVVDMQRDFIEPGGFGESLGNDVSRLQRAIEPTAAVLETCRELEMLIVHTREGHRPDLSNCPPTKRERGASDIAIGDEGPMGRLLVEGADGHGIVNELAPAADEPVIDKPGKGAFYATDLDPILRTERIANLIVAGVTTEVCVQSTVREANDRGYECVVLRDCVASYSPEMHRAALAMIVEQGGLFGWTADSDSLHNAL